MIEWDDLYREFGDVVTLSDGIYRARDVLSNGNVYYYFSLGLERNISFDLLAVTTAQEDHLAIEVLSKSAEYQIEKNRIFKIKIKYLVHDFDTLIVAPCKYHLYLNGRLDEQRSELALCAPTYWSEFSGTEKPEEFKNMCRDIVPIRQWERSPQPKTLLRFDNPVTKGGTGDGYVLSKFETILRELRNLNGVEMGFIEILNYKNDVLEILSPSRDQIIAVQGRDDRTRAPLSNENAADYIWAFLTDR